MPQCYLDEDSLIKTVPLSNLKITNHSLHNTIPSASRRPQNKSPISREIASIVAWIYLNSYLCRISRNGFFSRILVSSIIEMILIADSSTRNAIPDVSRWPQDKKFQTWRNCSKAHLDTLSPINIITGDPVWCGFWVAL